jgi:hypothetical protein
LQEQIERDGVAVVIKASKLTARILAKALAALARKIHKEHEKAQTPHGKQTLKKLMNHNVPTNTIPVEGDKGLFDKIARKYHVDYAFYKTGKSKYLLLFKSGQSDAITAAFSEYSSQTLKRAKDKRPPVIDIIKKAAERVERDKPKHRELAREKEAARE